MYNFLCVCKAICAPENRSISARQEVRVDFLVQLRVYRCTNDSTCYFFVVGLYWCSCTRRQNGNKKYKHSDTNNKNITITIIFINCIPTVKTNKTTRKRLVIRNGLLRTKVIIRIMMTISVMHRIMQESLEFAEQQQRKG